jgi:hypothetical protein
MRFIDGYLPRAGDVLPFMRVSGATSGGFTRVEFPDLAPGFQADLQPVDGGFALTALNDARAVSTTRPAGGPRGLCGAGLLMPLLLLIFGLGAAKFHPPTATEP